MSIATDTAKSGNRAKDASNTDDAAIRARIVEVAQNRIGVKEGPGNQNPFGPAEEWCALFVNYCWRKGGAKLPKNPSEALAAYLMDKGRKDGSFHTGNPSPGDSIHYGRAHVGIVETVKGTVITTIEGNTGNGTVARKGPADYKTHSLGPAPVAGFASPVPGGTGVSTNASGGSGSSSGGLDLQEAEKIAKAAAFSAYLELPGLMNSTESIALSGERSLMNDQPLLPFIQQLCQASLRNFQSMPNGDFFAFYPDYFGGLEWHSPYWEINDIEIIDGQIDLSDDALATHVYAIGDNSGFFDGIQIEDKVNTAGVVTIFEAFLADFMNKPVVKQEIQRETNDDAKKDQKPLDIGAIGDDPNYRGLLNKDKAISFIQKYGARPYVNEAPMVKSPFYEIFLAYQTFCLMWSRQFISQFTLTFMPELFPGGIVAFPTHGIQMYIDEVTHIFDYVNGFQTLVNFSAPAALPNASRQNVHGGMIRAGALNLVGNKQGSGKGVVPTQ